MIEQHLVEGQGLADARHWRQPDMLVVIRMTGLRYPPEHGDLIAKVVHDVLNGEGEQL